MNDYEIAIITQSDRSFRVVLCEYSYTYPAIIEGRDDLRPIKDREYLCLGIRSAIETTKELRSLYLDVRITLYGLKGSFNELDISELNKLINL